MSESRPPLDMGEAILRSLTGAMARRDTVAFLAFYAALYPEVYARLRAAVGDPARAEALTESVFVHAWRTASSCRGDEPVRAWLGGIVGRHTGIRIEPAALFCARGEFRRLLTRAGADADAERSPPREEPR
jgi:hypothetical protein